MVFIGLLVWVGLCIWIYFDAKQGGIMKNGKDMQPFGWFLGCLLLGVVFLPLYLMKRAQFKRGVTQSEDQIARIPAPATPVFIDRTASYRQPRASKPSQENQDFSRESFVIWFGFLTVILLSIGIGSASNKEMLVIFWTVCAINAFVYFRLCCRKIKRAVFIVILLTLPITVASLRVCLIPTFSFADASPGADLFGGSPDVSPAFPKPGELVCFVPPIDDPIIEVVGDWSEKTTVTPAQAASVTKGTWITRYPWGETKRTPGVLREGAKKAAVSFMLSKNSPVSGTGRFILKNAEGNGVLKEYQFRIYQHAGLGRVLYEISKLVHGIASLGSAIALGSALIILVGGRWSSELFGIG